MKTYWMSVLRIMVGIVVVLYMCAACFSLPLFVWGPWGLLWYVPVPFFMPAYEKIMGFVFNMPVPK
jgi:hypothetical protein